jgi:peptidoglycan hydrolase-like protein with peptidoglycan-binding domain
VSRDVAEVILQTDGSVREVNNPEIDTRQKVPTRNVSSRTVAEDLRAIAEGEKLIAVGSGSKRIGSGQVVASVRDMLASQVQNKQGLPPVNNPNVVDDNFRELVSRFQAEYAADNGLPSSFVDGLFGKATLTALNDARNPVPDAGVGTTQGTGERKSNVEEVILTPEGTATTRNNPEYETRGEDLSLNHSTNQASEDLSLVAAGRKTLAAGPGKKRIGSAPVIAEVRAMLGELVTNGYISGDGLSPSQNPIQADDNFKELVTRFQTQYAADKGLGNSFVDGLFGPKTLAALRQVSSETSRPVSEHIQGPGGWTEQTTTEIDDRLSYKSLVLPKVNPES